MAQESMGLIGTATYCPNAGEIRYQYLGVESAFKVYVAELTAIKLAIEIIQTCATKYKNCIIYANSQCATRRWQNQGDDLAKQFI